MSRQRDPGQGFTLLELLITLAIVSIVTTIAVGGYRDYLRRANRVDATTALLRIAAAQEKFYLQHGRYAGAAELTGAPPAGLGIGSTSHGYYTLAIELPDGGATLGFLASATADPAGPQHDDHDCEVFTIDERGRRTASTQGGESNEQITERCWR